jgi:D-glycero-beta-D-manno-heptose-7-phosphate kinase
VQELFNAFNNLKIMVVGDVMTDAYLWGKVERISPEAPVPVVSVQKRESRLGGAANVAINLQAMGAQPLLCSVIGDDRHGMELLGLMQDLRMETSGIVQSPNRVTTVKTRVIGNNHQLLRVDDEVIRDLNDAENDLLIARIEKLIREQQPQALVFEDYDKGVLGEKLIARVVALCQSAGIPTAVDPKKKNFAAYKNVDLFKPNLHELRSGLNLDIDKPTASILNSATQSFRQEHNIRMLMVTLSEAGVFFAKGDQADIIPAHIRNISDVSGAGDTVISVATLCLACGCSASTTAALANLAGGLVCEKVGVVPVDKNQLLAEAAELKL